MTDESGSINQFPVLKSFLSPGPLGKVIESAYGLSSVYCQLIQATMRDVYLVKSHHESYVLFLYRHNQRTSNEIAAEWEIVDYLKASGAPVAPAVRQKNGDLLLVIPAPEGIRYAVLATFIEGQHLRQHYSPEAVRRYGQAIGQIHTLSDLWADINSLPRPRHDFDFIVRQSLTALEPVMRRRPQDMAYLRKAAATLETWFASPPTHKPEFGFIHGDVIRANAQVSSNGEVTVLDFDLCGQGWRAYDVASYLQVAGTQEAREVFLAGYQQIRRLTDDELSWLPLFEATRYIFELGVPAMNLNHWGTAYLSERLIDASIEGLRQSMAKAGY